MKDSDKNKTLHILNGDSMHFQFSEVYRDASVFVWREALCQGPISYTIDSPTFVKQRLEFLQGLMPEHKISPSDYLIEAGRKISWSGLDAIYLWFEPDLFCQINQLATLSYLAQKNLKANIFALPIDYFNRLSKPIFSLFDATDFSNASDAFQSINSETLDLADQTWQYVSESDYGNIAAKILDCPFVNKELLVWLKQSSTLGIGAKIYEKEILRFCSTPQERKVLLRDMLQRFPELGYGDTQVDYIIEQLLLESKIQLTATNHLISGQKV